MNNSILPKEKLSQVEEELVKLIISGYQSSVLSYEEMKRASQYILENIAQVQTQDQLLTFLQNLAGNWAIFGNLAVLESGHKSLSEDQKSIDEITAYIKNLQINK